MARFPAPMNVPRNRYRGEREHEHDAGQRDGPSRQQGSIGQREDDRGREQAGDEPDGTAEAECGELSGDCSPQRKQPTEMAIRVAMRDWRNARRFAKSAISAAATPPLLLAAPLRVRIKERRLGG